MKWSGQWVCVVFISGTISWETCEWKVDKSLFAKLSWKCTTFADGILDACSCVGMWLCPYRVTQIIRIFIHSLHSIGFGDYRIYRRRNVEIAKRSDRVILPVICAIFSFRFSCQRQHIVSQKLWQYRVPSYRMRISRNNESYHHSHATQTSMQIRQSGQPSQRHVENGVNASTKCFDSILLSVNCPLHKSMADGTKTNTDWDWNGSLIRPDSIISTICRYFSKGKDGHPPCPCDDSFCIQICISDW